MKYRQFYNGHKTITFNTILKQYQLTQGELLKLIGERKLIVLPPSRIFFKETAVREFFETQAKKEIAPIVINAHDIIVKFKLEREEFSRLLAEKKLTPITVKGETNDYFSYKEVSALFPNKTNNLL